MEPIEITVYIYLIPQPSDKDPEGRVIHSDIISTMKAIKETTGAVNTYQTCIETLRKAVNVKNGEVAVILSNNRTVYITDTSYSLDNILNAEAGALIELYKVPKEQLQTKNSENDIRNNALDFYQSLYYEDNKEELKKDIVDIVLQTKEEVKDAIDNELAVINKIITAYNIQGTITEIVCNNTVVNQQEFLPILEKIKMDGYTVSGGCVSFSNTKEMNYSITFSSGTKIVRENLDFSVVENKTE